MAGEAHIKVAIANLQRAIKEKQHEISRLRVEMDRARKDVEGEVNILVGRVQQHNSVLGDPNRDDNEKARVAILLTQTKHRIDENRQRMTQIHDGMLQQIQALEGQVQALTNEINMMQQLR